jgi:tetratricopeptide (TPR) repeat protein
MHEDNVAILASLIKINCDFVRKNLGPKFNQNPSDLNLAKKIFNFMLKDKCTEDPLWLKAAEAIHAAEKDFGLTKILGIRYLTSKEHDKASKILEEALQLASKPSDKAEIFGLQAQQQEILGNHSKARELYVKALAIDPSKKEFYARIGDIYLNSFDECAKQKHQAEDRLVFLIAYDMYQKAGETQKMANAKTLFPSKEEIFELDYKNGDKIKVACWINEETIIRTRN